MLDVEPSFVLFFQTLTLSFSLAISLSDGFQTITNKKALVVYAESDELRSEWKTAIAAVISRLNGSSEKKEPREGHHIFSVSGTEFEMETKVSGRETKVERSPMRRAEAMNDIP